MPLLGLQTCREFNLIKRIHIIENCNTKDIFITENIDIFEGDGSLKKKCTIEVDEKNIPVASSPRKISYTVCDKLKGTLTKLAENNIKSGES